MEIPILEDLIKIFGLSVIVILVCHRLGIPTIVGFLVTGILCGPEGLGLIKEVSNVNFLAEIGIVLLLFTVGMEFSVKKILKNKRFFLLGGFLQVSFSIAAGFCISTAFGRPTGEAVFFGFLISLSSTAIVLRVLQERFESNTPHGRMILGILIFQDIVAVPMMLLTPLLGGSVNKFDYHFLAPLFKGLFILFFIFFAAGRYIPKLLHLIARTAKRELFLLTVMMICLSVAFISAKIGLSLALGAFLAGLIIAESEYSHQALGDVIPFLDIFTSIFFVSVGMLLDVRYLLQNPFLIITITTGVMLLKCGVVVLTSLLLGMPIRSGLMAGFALCQVGEFAFVLTKSGMTHNLGTPENYQLFLSVSIMTMALTPTLMAIAPYFGGLFLKLPIPEKIRTGFKPISMEEERKFESHVLIVGYGNVGRYLAKATREADIPYAIVDLDAEHVSDHKLTGEPIYFGDATHESVLRHLNVEKAKVIAILINHPLDSMRIVNICRRINPKAQIIARTKYIEETQPLYKLGASDVITDEFGVSVEVFVRVLSHYNTPINKINELVEEMRVEVYELLSLFYYAPVFDKTTDFEIGPVNLKTFKITNTSPVIGKSLGEIDLIKKYGLTVVLILRGKEKITNINSDTVFVAKDLVAVIGDRTGFKLGESLFSPSTKKERT